MRTDNIPAITGFNAEKYMGKWHEIARLPHYFETGMTDCVAEYKILSDGKISVINSGSKNGKRTSVEGTAHFVGQETVGELKVTFFWPFYGAYKIIYIEPNYSVAIVTSDTLDYFWILARESSIPEIQRRAYLEKAKKWGFNTQKIEFP